MEGPDSLVCKSITAPSPEVSVTKREVTSYKSMFGNVDRVNEIVDPGAFLDSIGPKGRLAKGQVTTRHNHKDLVGKMIHAEETSEGLLTTDKYGSDPVSDRVFSLVRDSIITTSSFQAKFKAAHRVKAKGPDGENVWHLTRLDLIEAGPADADYAVNPETRVVSVKGLQEISRVVSDLSMLNSQETWTLEGLKTLTPEDKDALLILLGQMPTGVSVQSIMAALQSEAAEDYTEAAGKAQSLADVFREWQEGRLISRLEKLSRRLSAAN